MRRGRPAKRARKPKITEEEEIMTTPEEKPEAKKPPSEKIYWAPSRNYRLHLSKKDPERVAEYQREIRNQRGDVVQVAAPIIWGENIFVTSDPEVQAVIEKSGAFQTGEIILCPTLDEAYKMTAGRTMQKVVTSGMISLTEETIRVGTIEEAQAEMRKQVSVTEGL